MLSFSKQRQLQTLRLLWAFASVALCAAQTTVDVRICPQEPFFNDSCPPPCTRCEGNICVIENPMGRQITCPEGLSCKINCFNSPTAGKIGCESLYIQCPKNSSCDLLCSGDSCRMAYFECPRGGKYSCSAQCDSISSIGSFICDNSTSCNCNSGCRAVKQCVPGVDCVGDPCWNSECGNLNVKYAEARVSYDAIAQECKCRCMNSSLIYDASSADTTCHDPATYCSGINQCGRGSCSLTTRKCVCQRALYRGSRCNETCSCNLNTTSSNVLACNFDNDTCICTTGWKGRFCNETDSSANICFPYSRLIDLDPPQEVPPTEPTPPSAAEPEAPLPSPVAVSPTTRSCPAGCTFCDGEWCVLDSRDLLLAGQLGDCPEGDFPCRIRCDDHLSACARVNRCGGNRPCEMLCGGKACEGSVFRCSSTISCRSICQNAPEGLEYDIGAIRIFQDPQYATTNTSTCPLVDLGTCRQRNPCIPGLSCVPQDPCSAHDCFSSRTAVLSSDGVSCECRCRNGTLDAGGFCLTLATVQNCTSPCQNGGLCVNGKCQCPTGFVGEFCGSSAPNSTDLMVTYQSRISQYCPTRCSYCTNGVCVLRVQASDLTCPEGWPCLFICDHQFCQAQLTCTGTSGPCTLLCLNAKIPDLTFFFFSGGTSYRSRFAELRVTPSGSCVNVRLNCDTRLTGLPCGAICANAPGSNLNQLRSISCSNDTSPSDSPVVVSTTFGSDLQPRSPGKSNCWMSETCQITSLDPCFVYSTNSYRFVCPIAANGFELLAQPIRNASGSLVCACFCPPGYKEQKFISAGYEDRYCVPTTDCTPACSNGGLCVYTSSNSSSVKCQCFSGFTGPTCESRCFFPVAANITSCENGRYVINGNIVINLNRTVDIFEEADGLVELDVSGNLTLSNRTNLVLNSTASNATVIVRGNFLQADLSSLTQIIIVDGTLISTVGLSITGEAILNGNFQLSVDTERLAAALRLNGGSISLSLLNSSSFSSTSLKNGDILSRSDASQTCAAEIVVARAQVTSKSLSAVFSLEANPRASSPECTRRPNEFDANVGAVQTSAIVIGVLVPAAAVAIGAGAFAWWRHKINVSKKLMMQKIYQVQSETEKSAVAAAPTSVLPSASAPKPGWKAARVESVELQPMNQT